MRYPGRLAGSLVASHRLGPLKRGARRLSPRGTLKAIRAGKLSVRKKLSNAFVRRLRNRRALGPAGGWWGDAVELPVQPITRKAGQNFGIAAKEDIDAFNCRGTNLRGEKLRVLIGDSIECGEGASYLRRGRPGLRRFPKSDSGGGCAPSTPQGQPRSASVQANLTLGRGGGG